MKQKKITLGKQILNAHNIHTVYPYTLPIKKVRGNRLYDYDSNIYIDFYLQDNSVLLGYKPKPLSTLIKNRISIGYLGGFVNHLYNRTYNAIQSFFNLKNQLPIFFSSLQERTLFVEKYLPKKEIISIHIFSETKNITEYFYLNSDIANGAPVYILVVPSSIDLPHEFPYHIAPFIYESILYTLKQFSEKKIFEKFDMIKQGFKQQKWISPFQIDLGIEEKQWYSLLPVLEKEGFIINPYQSILSICTETKIHDIKNILNILKKIHQ